MTNQGNTGWAPKRGQSKFSEYDSLPPEVRKALQEAEFDVATGTLYKSLRNGASVAWAVGAIRKLCADKIAADRTRVWGLSKVEASLAELGLD